MPQGGEDARVNVFKPELVTSACVVHLQGSGCQERPVSDSVFVHELQWAPGGQEAAWGAWLGDKEPPWVVGKHVRFLILFLDFSGLEHALFKLMP